MGFTLYGLTGLNIQYWNGSNWVTVPNGSIAGNNKIWTKIVFPAVTTSGIRVVVNSAIDGTWSRIAEVEALGGDSSGNVRPPPVPPVTPTIASVTPHADPTCLNIVINPVAGALSYNVRAVINGYTINVLQTSFPWCGLTANTFYDFQAQAVNNVGASGWSPAVGGTTGAAVPTPTPPPTVTYTLTASPSSTTTYSTVVVNWTASQSRPTSDYVGLFLVGAANNDPRSTQNITGGTSGQTSVNMTSTGSFHFRYFATGNPTPVAVSNTFTVVALSVTLTAPSTTLTAPASVTTNWTANSSRPATDSIKLYRGTTMVSSQNILAGTSGARTFVGLPKGTYTFRYFVQGNATPIKTSNSFIVK